MILPDCLTLLLLRAVVSPVSGACVNTYLSFCSPSSTAGVVAFDNTINPSHSRQSMTGPRLESREHA
jgi:hypothetical protein